MIAMKTDLKTLFSEFGVRREELARTLGVNKCQITRWTQKRVPAERVVAIERVTGIPRHMLRPDIFGPTGPEDSAQA